MEIKKEVYPVNGTARQYHDADGNPTTLYRLVREEPDWAMSRIKAGEQAIAQRDELLAALAGAIAAWDGIYPHLKSDVHSQDYIEEIEWAQMQAARAAIAKCEVKS